MPRTFPSGQRGREVMFGHLGCSFLCSLWPEKIEGVTDRNTPVTYLYRRAYSRLHVGKSKAAGADCCCARYDLRAMNNDIWAAGLPFAQLGLLYHSLIHSIHDGSYREDYIEIYPNRPPSTPATRLVRNTTAISSTPAIKSGRLTSASSGIHHKHYSSHSHEHF